MLMSVSLSSSALSFGFMGNGTHLDGAMLGGTAKMAANFNVFKTSN